MKESSHHDEVKSHGHYREALYKRHFQGALINSAGCVIMLIFVFCAFYANVIKMNQFMGVTLGLTYLILINPPTLWLLKRITSVRLQKYFSILIEFLIILGFTVNIYFLGGIEVAYLTLIYGALIMYVGIVGPRELPFIIAILCSATFTITIAAEHFGLIPHQGQFNSFDMPWLTQLLSLLVIFTLLIITAYIASYTAGLLRKNRDKLREQNVDLMEKTATLAAAEQQLLKEHQDLEIRIKERTSELVKANEDLESELAARRQAEIALKESERRHRELTDFLPISIFEIDSAGRIVSFNQNALEVFRYNREDYKEDMNALQFFPPEEWQRLEENMTKVIQRTSTPGQEYTLLRKDGSTFIGLTYSSPIIRENNPVGIRGAIIDITERKRADTELRKAYQQLRAADEQMQAQYNSLVESEQSLRESEESYKYLVQHAPTGIYEVDFTTLKLLSVNDAMCQYTGYTREEFLSMDPLQLLTEESLKSLIQRHAQILAGEPVPDSIEYQLKRKDGSEFWALLNNRFSYEPDNRIIATVIAHDITERKIMEQFLRDSKDKYRNIMESIDEAYFELDLKGNMTFWNDSTLRIGGYARSELMNMNYRQYSSPETAKMLRDVFSNIYKTGEKESLYDFELIRKDKSARNMELSVNLMRNSAGEAIGFRCIARDITERKRAEIARRESESLYRLLADNMSDTVWLMDLNLNTTYVSPSAGKMRGYTEEEIKQLPLDKHLTPASLKVAKELFSDQMSKVMADPTYVVAATAELEFYRKDGTTFWLECRFRTIQDEKGEYVSILGEGRDITERRRAEEALHQSEEKYRLIAENMADVISVQDMNLRFTYISPSIMRLRGFTVEEAMEQTLDQVMTPESLKSAFTVFEEEMKLEVSGTTDTDRIRTIEVEEYRKDGSIIWVEISLSFLRDKDHKPVAILAATRDITESKRADEALHQSEEKYRAIIENMEEGYIEVDLKGRLTFFNEAAMNFLGYSREETMGMHYKNYTDEENARRIFEAYSGVYKTGVPLPLFEWEVIRKDGARRTVEGSASLIADAGGRPVGFRGLFRDTTDRKHLQDEHEHLQERLNRAEKMEALGTLAGGVAHDINNVLGVLVGYSELLLERIEEGNSLRSYASNIMNSSLKAGAIIQDLLTLARRGVAVSEVINLNKVITDYIEAPEFEKLKAYHPHVIFKNDLEEVLPNIKGSPVHLEKTIMNLVSNASEAISGQGEVIIRTRRCYIDKPIRGYDDVREGYYVVLTVSDNGRGISVADIKKIFEPFYTKKVMGRSGTGLGLAVVWGTVKDHDGYIDVQSEDGKGSTFTIYLPATREEEVAGDKQKASPEQYMGKGETILVVDDVKEQREVATSMLTRLGYRVESVSSGEEATAFLKTHAIDLLLLDMIMDPGIDGLETYQRVLAINPKQKAIIVSGFSETDRVHAAQALGAGSYVRKPYIMEKLGLAVKNELIKK